MKLNGRLFTEGEVGEAVTLTIIGHEPEPSRINATWLGTVSNGAELAEACSLMAALDAERMGGGSQVDEEAQGGQKERVAADARTDA